jgi:hypothetical protein
MDKISSNLHADSGSKLTAFLVEFFRDGADEICKPILAEKMVSGNFARRI